MEAGCMLMLGGGVFGAGPWARGPPRLAEAGGVV